MAISGISSTIEPPVSPAQPAYVAPTPVVGKADAATVSTAVDLGSMSSIISTLGASYSGPTTYNALGLLNSITSAGKSTSSTPTTPPVGTDTQSYEQDLTDFAVVSTLSSSTSESGVYTSSGSVQDLPTSSSDDSAIVNTFA